MKRGVRVILSGGGTGGHIYPAISIANEIKERYPDAEILFVGAEDRMEMQKVPEAGYKIEGLWISGFQRKLSFKNLLFPVKLMKSLWKAKKILNRFKPDVVVGTGGFASGPLLQMANQNNIPTVVQEQNSLAGVTNKLLAKKANVICTAYPDMERFFPAEKTVLTGNPVRQDLLSVPQKREEAISFFKLDPEKKILLVLGGSLGARKINELVHENLVEFERHNLQIIWQTGTLYFDEYRKYNEAGNVKTYAFMNRMDLAYAGADVIISRAGAGTVSELCIVGKPVLFVPSPNVAEDHQTKNALALAQRDAAVVISEKDLDKKFREIFFPLLESEDKLYELGKNIQKMAKPYATSNIVDEIEKLIGKK
ncbi:undecaprenyldiphospho-muramoylpentapeptide beta-N-acetylglucosaminyltransferase [Salinimicrobium sp. GXAS 041]|uniref:undecaprenyldiphospho-muramoylpentapeptide beta-N-acetylglucosaminyltransferase n=1 Tax=Salinimicrobium sp. GXAS 041 TaxID=3400806 RepID=UPI003C71F6D6